MSEWWKGAVIYQIYPRSFQDDSGDGIGDLKGITRRLPHIASLGCDAIWLSPIFTSPQADMGYDVSDYRGIDPLFGTIADFDEMVAAAHDLGLKVIVDQVLSHSSDKHPWFEESRRDKTNDRADWYVWADPLPDGMPPNNWPSVFGGTAWEWDTRRRQYYLHNFLIEQPDLNFHNPKVQDALLDTMKFWLERGVDGFRLDTVNYYFHDEHLRSNPPAKRNETRPAVNPYDMQEHLYSKTRPDNVAFLQRMRKLTDQYGERAMVGEVGEHGDRSIKVMSEYTKGTDRLHMAYSFAMLSDDFTARHFRDNIDHFFKGAPDGWPCWSFSNHDVIRHVTRWAKHFAEEGDRGMSAAEDAVAKLSIAMLASFEGTICIYQGEELGQTETDILWEELTDPPGFKFWPDYKGRDGCRTPMVWDWSENGGFSDVKPWLPVKVPQLARNVVAQTEGKDTVLDTYRSILAFRRAEAALQDGRTEFIDLPEPLLAFHRTGAAERITCVFNLDDAPVRLSVSGQATAAGPGTLAVGENEMTLPAGGFGWLRSPADAKAPLIEMPKAKVAGKV